MNTNNSYARPFLKWAGGKGQLLEQFQTYFPSELNGKGIIKRYYEPFLGSGAVFFWVKQNCRLEEAFINEFNPEIYLCYVAIQNHVEKVIKCLQGLEKQYYKLDNIGQERFYYQVRQEYNITRKNLEVKKYKVREDNRRVATTIFLNKTCFNGLYRVNSRGEFNVPFGRYRNPTICDGLNLRAVSNLLQGVIITNDDFSIVEKQVQKESFIYFDPPYRPLNKTSNFTSYSNNEFNDIEQKRLSGLVKKLNRINGVKIMLSNSDPKNENKNDNFFEQLYAGFRIERLKAKRMINCNASRRGEINEILVMNY